MILQIEDGGKAEVPRSLTINGLRITLADQRFQQSAQFGAGGFKTTSTATYIYLVVPQFEGDFTIPPFEVKAKGKAFNTQPMRLTVTGGTQVPVLPALPSAPGIAPSPGTPPPSNNEAPAYFARLLLSKKKAYVGEVLPAELRFYFNSRIGGQLGERPAFGGEGFTVQKFSNATKAEEVIDGEVYTVFKFQTAITPAKAGTLEIPPAKLDARLQLPDTTGQGVPDIFGQFGGMLPPGLFSETRDVTIETSPQSLEVVPLPKEGRPDDFSGAVGRFTMETSVSPKKATPGEPITLTATITGQGNLEAMGAPTLTGDEGWRTYPPSDKLTQADSIGFSGEKAFEFPIVARTPQTRTPGVRFSFFDPTSGKFETLEADPLAVEASAAPATADATPSATGGTPAPTPVASGPADASDVLLTATAPSSWRSLLFRREFLLANAALAITWLALFAFFALRRYAVSEAGIASSRRRRAKDALKNLAVAEPKDFYQSAMECLCLCLDCDPLRVPEKLAVVPLSPEAREHLEQVVHRHAESRYAAGSSRIPEQTERTAILHAFQDLEKSRR